MFCIGQATSGLVYKLTHDGIIWLFTILTDKKDYLQKKLRQTNIETNQVHFRNDRYSIFKSFIKNKKFPNMNSIEKKYLVLPIHTKMKISDANYVANTVNKILS